MDNRTSGIRDEAFVFTGRLREGRVSRHLTRYLHLSIVTGPSQDQIWIAMEIGTSRRRLSRHRSVSL
jgi:hypothetical protein